MLQEKFDFDQWKNLAESDPHGFFTARERLIAEFIASAPPTMTASLQQFQDSIDCARAEAVSPSKAVQVILGMIGDHLEALLENMARLRDESNSLEHMMGQLKE